MIFGLTEDQEGILDGLDRLLATEAPQRIIGPDIYAYKESLDKALAKSGFLDIARLDGFGILDAALIVERVARVPDVVEAGATAIVAPAFDIGEGVRPVALLQGGLTKAARFLPMAKVLLVDMGDHALKVMVDPDNVEPVETLLAYPYGKLRSTEGLDQQVIEDVATLRRRWRIALAAEAAGAMAAGLQTVVAHVTDRVAFGRPLGSFQAIQHRLAMTAETVESTKWLAFRAAWSDSEADAAIAAGFAQSRVAQLSYDLHQFSGAMGLTLEFPLHLWTYRLRALAGELGGASMQARSRGSRVAGRGMTQSIGEFREQARAWLSANIPSELSPEDGPEYRAFVLGWIKRQAGGGWSGLSWPKEVGGRGLSVLEQIVWFEEYARAKAPTPLDASFVAINHAGPTLIVCGTDEHKAFHLPKILAGESIWCQGFSEPGAGSDLAGLKTRGVVEGDELVINGAKIWCSFADIADWQELLIRTDPEASTSKALSWVICPMHTPGITVRPIKTMAGPHKYCEVFYDNVRVPIANVVGGLNNGWATAMSTLGFERGTASLALLIGLTMKVEELLAACPADRPQMRARLAQLRAEGASIRASAYRFALASEDSVPDASGSIIRLSFSEFCQKVTAAAIDLFGIDAPEVIGMHGWGHDYLDAFSETIAGGTSEIQRNIIGERVLGLPKGPR